MAKLVHQIKILAMDESVLRGMLDKSALAKAKSHAKKSSINIKVFGFASEGFHTFSGPGGIGKISQVWTRESVYSAHDKLQMETPLFFGHEDKPASEREPYGFVIGKDIQTIDDREQAVVAVYIYPEHESKRLDVVSIEAMTDIMYQNDTQYVLGISEISAIAVGDSEIMKPAFSNATLKAQIAAFAALQTPEKEKSNMLTPGEIRKAINELGLTARDLFSHAELTKDSAIAEIVEREKGAIEEQYKKERSETEKKIKDSETRIAELSKKAAYSEFSQRLPKIAQDRKLSEKQQKFLESNAGKLMITDPAKVEDEIATFVESSLEEYKKTAQLFGIEDDTNTKNEVENTDGSDIATPPNNKKKSEDNFLL